MKKVGKEFKKTLSAILVAAMVFTSLPQTTLVAKAEEADQQVYELNGSSVVGNGESDTISPEFVVKDESGNVLNVTVSNATVQTEKTDSSKYYVYDGFTLSDSNCSVVKVGGVTKTSDIYNGHAGYVFDKPAEGEPVVVTVSYAAKNITVADGESTTAGDAIVTFDSSTVTTTTSGNTTTYKTKAGKSVKFKASVKSGVDAEVTKVEYAIGSGGKTVLTAKASGYYVIENATISDDITITVTLAYKHKVTFANINGLTIKYAPSSETDITKFETFTNASSLKSGTYNFWIDAGEKTISSVKVDGTEKYPSATKVSGVTVYPVEVSAADVAVVVETATASKTVPVTLGTGVKAVYYYASDDADVSAPATSLFTKVTGSKIALDSTAAKLFVYAEYENNYTVNDVTINGTKVTEPAPTAETVYTVPLGADTLSVAVTAKKIEKTIVFNAVGTAENIHGKVVVEKANIVKVGTGEDAKAPTADVEITTEDKTLTVNQGDTIKFRVTANDGYEVVSVKQNTTDVKKYVVGDDTYYEVTIGASNENVAVTIDKIEGKKVTFLANADIDKINEYVNGATQATEKAYSTSPVDVEYNKSYKFEIKSYANEIKIVDKVSYKLADDEKYTELTPANGVYTIDKITKDVTIKIETKLNVAKVNAFSVEFNKDEFTAVSADVARLDEKGATVSDPIVSGKTYYVTGNDANNKVNLTITPKAGLKETVTGAKLNDAKTAYVIDFGTTKVDNADKAKVGQNVPVKVTTAVDDTAVEKNQFVEFTTMDEFTTLDVNGATKLTDDKDTYKNRFVYEIDKATKEVTFTLTVPYGKKLEFTPNNTVVFQTAEPEIKDAGVVYSYKILVNQVNHADKASPLAIAIGNTVDDEVAFAITGDSSKYNAYYYSGESKFVATSRDYVVGTEIYIEITDSDYKLVQVVDGKDVDVELDAFSKYSVIISEAVNFKVVAKAEAPAAKDYTVTVNKVIFDQDTETESTTTADLTKEVLANDKFEITAQTNPQAPASPADVTFTKAAFTEEVKSTLSLNNDKSKATVVIAAEDAGKTLTVNLYADEVNGAQTKKDVLVGTVEFKTAKAVASATVKDGKTAIKNGGKVTKDALTETIFDVTVSPETELSYYDVKVVSGDATVAWVNAKTKKQIKVVTPAKAESTVINIINTVTGKSIFGFTVETKLPELKLAKVDSLAQSFNKINLTLTADKNVKNAVDGAYVYYEVTVTPQEGTAPVGSAKKVLYIAKNGESQNEEITVNTADKTKAAWKYDFEVRLVLSQTQLSDGTTAATNLVAAGKSIKKTFATKNAYYEDKLSVTKKTTTIYTGQSDVTAAVVKFSKNASYVDNVTIKRVLDKDGVDRTGWFTINGGTVDNNGYEVKLGVNTTTAPGKYTVEIAAEAEKSADNVPTMYRATAVLPITVVAGINSIDVDRNVRIAQTGKKDVSYTIKPVGYSDAYVKAKSQKFTYEPYYNGLNAVQKANVEKNVAVNKTNGKVTIKKGFVLGNDWKDNCFKVKVTANDFTNADGSARTTAIVEFLVAPEVIEIGEIYVAPNNDDSKNLGTTLTRDQANGAQIIVKDTDGNIINDCVTFTPAFKNEKSSGVYYDSDYDNDRLFVAKAGTITVKATTTDGGKKSKSIKLTIKNKDFTNMSYEVYSIGANAPTVVETAQNQWNYKATTTPTLVLAVKDIAKDGTKNDAEMSVYNYTAKVVKGGTLAYTYTDGIKFIPTAKETKVAIKVGKTTTNVTITNDTYPTEKAPKATTKDKLYMGLFNAKTGAAVSQKLTYTVNSDKYTHVNVTPVNADPYGFVPYYDGTATYPITTGQKFELQTHNWIGTGKYYSSAKYVFVYGSVDANDNFIPATQPATVTIKAANTAAFKPVTSYKINPANSKTITLTGKPENVDVIYYNLQNANVKGQPNKFLDLFEQDFDALGNPLNTLTLKTDEAAKKALEDKANYTGYITYKYVNTSGDSVVKTTKITVSFDSKTPKYTADAKDVLKGAPTTVTTTIKLGGKAVELSANATDIVSATAGWTAVKGANAGEVLLTAAAPEIGKNKVDIKFITADSANLGTGADKNGTTVTATINVIDPATSTKKVSPNKVTADLSSKNVVKSYSDVDKTGIYTIALTETYKINVAGTVVSAMAVASNAPAGITVAFDKATDTVTFSVKANSIQAGKTVKVPVELTFDGTAAKETITFNVIAPKTIPTANTAVESVKAYLAKYYAKSDDANLQANLQKEINPITGVKVTSVTTHFVDEVKDAQGKVTTAASYTVDVVLSNPADVTKPIELKNVAVLAPKAADPAKQDTAAKALAAVTARANTTYIVTTLSADKDTAAKQLQVSASSTRFTIRQYLQSQITGDYTLAMPSYEMKAPVDEVKDKDGNTTTAKEDGYIKFTYGVVGQTESLYYNSTLNVAGFDDPSELTTVTIVLPGKSAQ